MAVTDSAKLDYLWKKVGYGVTKTAPPDNKEAFNESIPSPLIYRGDLVMVDSGDIPTVIPTTSSSIVEVYKDNSAGNSWTATVECTEDLTAPDNRTWKTNLQNWVPTQFGSTYLVKVYVANAAVSDPQTVGTQLFQAGSGNNDEWFFDYQSGVLNFNGANIPSVIGTGVTGKSVYISGARYVGEFGVASPNGIGNLSIANTTITTDGTIGNITIEPTGTGFAIIDTVTGLVIPVGNTVQRPGSPITGTLRFNTSLTEAEIWDGTQWTGVGGGGNVATVTDQQITPDGSSLVYTLDQAATNGTVLVSFNGVSQLPGVAYTVSGNSITFSQAPETTDIIDIRFLAGAATNDKILNTTGNTFVQSTDSSTIVFSVAESNVGTFTTAGVFNISAGHSLQLPVYTVANATALSNVATGQLIYVSNGDGGNPCLAVYSGGAFKRVSLGATIST